MECVQVGLQQGGFGGLFLKRSSSPRPVIWQEVVNGQNGGISSSAGDDSFVDQLLNLNAENTQEEVDAEEEDYTQVKDKNSALPSSPPPLQPPLTAGEDDFGSLLTLPEEEADLEWLSHFVEDSFAQFSHAQLPAKPIPEILQPLSPLSPPSVLPRSRRSKRLRPAAVRSWTQASPRISSSLTDSTTSSSQSSSATSSPYWPTSPSTPLAFPNPTKKKGLGRAKPAGESRPGSTAMRRCSHCGTQKTPQWRAGPMGSKTLCNACGVRFKTGRLFPEYRPACSPTFSSELHSNSHRKVLEMRRMKKETVGYTEPGSVSAEPN